MNFSSMSFVINSIVAKEIGDMDAAYEQFMISAGEDLDESLTGRHDVRDGIHGTASGGAWLAAVSGFGGVFLSERGLSVNPRLPKHWTALQFRLVYRGEELSFTVTQSALAISAGTRGTAAVPLIILGEPESLTPGETRQWSLG
jgi:trehalose/maltose hydrolase-like predicted phosphorylase